MVLVGEPKPDNRDSHEVGRDSEVRIQKLLSKTQYFKWVNSTQNRDILDKRGVDLVAFLTE